MSSKIGLIIKIIQKYILRLLRSKSQTPHFHLLFPVNTHGELVKLGYVFHFSMFENVKILIVYSYHSVIA